MCFEGVFGSFGKDLGKNLGAGGVELHASGFLEFI